MTSCAGRVRTAVGMLAVPWIASGCYGSGEGPDRPGAENVASASAALDVEVGPGAISASYAERTNLVHGVAGDESVVFSTEPLDGDVTVLDRITGVQRAVLPPPPAGFQLAFAVRVPYEGRVVVLDSGGFPSPTAPSIPKIYDYDYQAGGDGSFTATLVRTVDFSGLPVVFAEDIATGSDGVYYMSESILGGIWVVLPDGTIEPGLLPSSLAPGAGIPALAPCGFTPIVVGGLPFTTAGNFAPGVGGLAIGGAELYFGSTCTGGLSRVPRASLVDPTRTPQERAADIQSVSPRPADVVEEAFEGIAVNPFDPADTSAYVTDSLQLRVLRIDVSTGAREVLANDPVLFNFPVALSVLPPLLGVTPLVVSSDQEYRVASINAGITEDELEPPFILAKVYTGP
jgi:hypothetical protein